MTDCPRRNAWFRGCRFEPRYDEGAPEIGHLKGSAGSVVKAMQVSKPRTYVRDVCVTCGRTVEREQRS